MAIGAIRRPFSESLEPIVDHDGHHGHGDGKRCHPSKDGPEASNSIVDDGANHEWISTGGALLVNPGLSRPPQLGQIDILRR
jgi:hypothetical protein